jgi:transcription elongation GreA/GreB family factor
LKALDEAMAEARAAYDAAQKIEDVNERRRAAAPAFRDLRYFAGLVPLPTTRTAVAFGNRVTFRREDGRHQTFRIVGEDEADPRNGSISYVSPVARALTGKAVGEVVIVDDHEIEVLAIA